MTTTNLDFDNLLVRPVGGLIHEDVINRIMAVDTPPVLPLTSRLGKVSSSNQFTEWTQDRLDDAADPLAAPNAKIDGYAATGDDSSLGQRVGNHTQISVKDIEVSSGADAVNTIGFANALAYQIAKQGKTLMLDIEADMLANKAAVAATSAVAGQSGGLEAWLDGNKLVPDTDGTTTYIATAARQDLTAGDIAGGGWENRTTNVVPAWVYTTATPVAMTEASIKAVMQALFENTRGRMNDRILMTNATLHTVISDYYFTSTARVATFTAETNQEGPATAMGAVNSILTNYGVLKMIPNANQGFADTADSTPDSSTAFILDFSTLKQASLRTMRVETIGKAGLSERRLLSHYWTLKPTTTEDQGIIQGIDNAVAMIAAK